MIKEIKEKLKAYKATIDDEGYQITFDVKTEEWSADEENITDYDILTAGRLCIPNKNEAKELCEWLTKRKASMYSMEKAIEEMHYDEIWQAKWNEPTKDIPVSFPETAAKSNKKRISITDAGNNNLLAHIEVDLNSGEITIMHSDVVNVNEDGEYMLVSL